MPNLDRNLTPAELEATIANTGTIAHAGEPGTALPPLEPRATWPAFEALLHYLWGETSTGAYDKAQWARFHRMLLQLKPPPSNLCTCTFLCRYDAAGADLGAAAGQSANTCRAIRSRAGLRIAR